jgi:alpha-L-fucosidase
MQQRLRDIGSWLTINGEAIFGTRPWASASDPAVRYTRNGEDLYVHLLEWPEGEVRIDGLDPGEHPSVTLLGSERSIEWHADGRSVIFTPPLMSPSEVPSPYAYVFKISAALP